MKLTRISANTTSHESHKHSRHRFLREKDPIVSHEVVQRYVDVLKSARQPVEYIQVDGAGHAFFDWKPDATTRATFQKYGVKYAAEMQAFFNSVFY